MEIGLIGLPQSGKSTLLTALTKGRAEASTQSSSRQDIRVGISKMFDSRLETLVGMYNPDKTVPAEVQYWDVPASSAGPDDKAGIGGQFLNQLQSADALLHVVRAFGDPSVPHISGNVDPHRDVATMAADLAFSDLEILERRVLRIEESLKGPKGRERDLLLKEGPLLKRLKDGLESDVPIREQHVLPEEEAIISNYQLLTAKPLLLVFNIDEETLPGKDDLDQELASRYNKPGAKATPMCGKLEMELSQLAPEDEREFRESMGLQESGVDNVVHLSYDLLSLVSFFTYGPDEVRAWSIPANTPAVKAAGKIHTDLERGFIRAEVVAFDDLARCGSMGQCKNQGLLRLEGKGYPIKDGDVVTFLFNV